MDPTNTYEVRIIKKFVNQDEAIAYAAQLFNKHQDYYKIELRINGIAIWYGFHIQPWGTD